MNKMIGKKSSERNQRVKKKSETKETQIKQK
jgi:hypothetical protein